jgi:hypothetical protein
MGLLSMNLHLRLAALAFVLAAACRGGAPRPAQSDASRAEPPEASPDASLPRPSAAAAQGLRLQGETRVTDAMPDTLRVAILVLNDGSAAREFRYESCSRVRAYRADEGTGRPVWDSTRRRAWPHGAPIVCGGQVLHGYVEPGGSTGPDRIVRRFPVPEILGDSLPAGRYRFVVEFVLNDQPAVVPAGEANLRR